jgi:hypothetical protein
MSILRVLRLAAAAAALSVPVAAPAVAGSCCDDVRVAYGAVPLPFPARFAPVYAVDLGPVFEGPGVYTYHVAIPLPPPQWNGGHAFPYVRHTNRRPYRAYGVAPFGMW